MDPSYPSPSQYLENRKIAHQAEVARAQQAHEKAARSSKGGRDSVLSDELSKQRNGASPAPSAWRSAEQNSSRKTSVAGGLSNSSPRIFGLREGEDAWAKLKNENIQLKTALDAARQQVYDLRHKLKDAIALGEENEKLEILLRDAFAELQLRERAVDEAVNQITELEQRNRELEEELARLRRTRVQSSTRASARSSSPSGETVPLQTPPQTRATRPLRGTVSPDVSARIGSLALSGDEEATRQQLPSFITANDASTAALRQLFTNGDKLIRPIPSQATLLSVEDEEEDPHAALRSPIFSEMSDEELGTAQDQLAPDVEVYDDEDDGSPLVDYSNQRRMEETGRWVRNSSTSPTQTRRAAKPSRKSRDEFQSLGQVLQRAPESAATTQRRQKPKKQLPSDDTSERTPPASANPTYGPNLFPPTPDTMVTGPNTSTSSFAVDRHAHHHDITRQSNVTSRMQRATSHQDLFTTRRLKEQPSKASGRDFMPQMFDPYNEPAAADPFARPIDMSDSSESPDTPRRPFFPTRSLAGSTMIDAESTRDFPPSRSSQSPERIFESRQIPLRVKTVQNVNDSQRSNSRRPAQYDGSSDNRTVSSRSGQSTNLSKSSLTQSPHSTDSRGVNSGIPMMPVSQVSRTADAMSPTSGEKHERRPSRAAALRQRFNKFTRRASNADESEFTPTARPSRRNSITQRLGLRRDSSTSQTTPIVAKFGSDSGAAFGQAPTASAPALAHETPQRGVAPSSPNRSKSERHPTHRPKAGPTVSTQSIPGRKVARSPDARPVAGEFGELRSPLAGATQSFPTRVGGKLGNDEPCIETATIPVAFAVRGRDSMSGSKRRNVFRSLSRTRTSTEPPRRRG